MAAAGVVSRDEPLMMIASGVRGVFWDGALRARSGSSLSSARYPLGELNGCLFVAAAGRVSPRRASHFLCWCKESNQRKHLNTISLAVTGRCAPAGGGDAHRAHERAKHQWWCQAKPPSIQRPVDFERAHARDSSPVALHGAQRPWPASQIVFNVLSLVTFFARAKKVTRPPGRDPAGGSQEQKTDQFAKNEEAHGPTPGEGARSC